MMITHRRIQVRPAGALAAALVLAGCTALTRDVLVKESAHPKPAVVSHCSGSEWMDNSMIAVVPIPIVAFASPTQEINDITTDGVLQRCGPPERLANRHVEVDRGLCVPLTLTRLITLGVGAPDRGAIRTLVRRSRPRAVTGGGRVSPRRAASSRPFGMGARR